MSSINVTPEHIKIAETFVAKTHANGGLAPVDLNRFWETQEAARRDPWNGPQVALGIGMSSECCFDELDIPIDYHTLTHNHAYRLDLHTRYNNLAEKIVGKRLLSEAPAPDPALQYPGVKQLHDIFEARNEWHNESYWLMQAATNEDELSALLDRVEARLNDLRAFILPENWDAERSRLMAAGRKPGLYRGQRGPVTFAMSVYGVENLIYLILDNPELAGRLRDLILEAMLERARILDEEAGYSPTEAPRGFSFADDNCTLLTADMYEFFAYPILKGMFDRYCPAPEDRRGQHSDSDMEHLLPILGRCDLRWTNFGPTVMVDKIREHLPNAVIHGQLAPFVFSRNEEVNIVAELLRDIELAGDERGLLFATAGSINNGSRLTGLRLIMAAIQEFGQYQ
ncbi:MAG: hypothetical protein HN742_35315 [Lentisphaerae bacterium]|jgi:uroporphyrinogen decarboxylase|nr:hypothetical protein [Lentisphaerota bacterium]MBT4822543.1 hypothetical protein [Lentisphaerota bacterium]MBT5604686.1 hypothetical protein [Lentisphaerota bacterium]MBT7053814.1 hypothetical protein [Lentisphaerota bacterium]MBT7847193.1 hypothetical protein [Lentisphaerota bacterium]